RSARALVRLLDERRIEILHTHNPYADFVGLAASRMRPVKTITTVYVWDDLGWKRNVLQWLDRAAIRHFDVVSAHCEDTYRRTLEFGFAREKVTTLICGYEAESATLSRDERRRGRAALGADEGDLVFANIARLWPEKAQDMLLRAFRRVADRHPEARLWIAGVGPSESALRALCTGLGLDDRVRFLGFVKDLPGLLALVDVMVDPAQAAGVSLAICSGMAAGLPIAATDVGGLREVLKPGQTALLFPKDDEDACVEAMLHLAQDADQRARLGDAAREFLATRYSLDGAVAAVEKTYDSLVTR
ncbi:MAG: glycosyltransferase, partial [Burkholderiales bacterium]|nr:glycosyltransferase [Burkholderiales bacterium]